MEEDVSTIYWAEKPELYRPTLVAAFAGWPDAGEVASGALRYLAAKLGARRLGHFPSDEFYDFTSARPVVAIEKGAVQSLRYPSTDLFYWRNPAGERDLVVLLASEPQLRWRRYLRTVVHLVNEVGAELVVTLGGLYDSVPHTAAPPISGLATSPALRERLARAGVALTDYQGPSSIHSALVQALQQNGVESVSLWGHAPIYVRAIANPKVCHALLEKLCHLVAVPLNLDDLRAAGEYLDRTLSRLLGQNEELRLYVNRLQAQQESGSEPAAEAAEDTERIIRDVEEFLRREQRRAQDEPEE